MSPVWQPAHDGAAKAQLRALQQVLDTHAAPQDAQAQSILKSGAEAVVASGLYQGQGAVFKQILGVDPADTAMAIASALRSYADVLAPYRAAGVVTPLAVFPDAGIVVQSVAPGTLVSDRLRRAMGHKRTAVLTRCGGWIAACAGDDTTQRPMAPRRMLDRLHDRMQPAQTAQAADLAAALYDDLLGQCRDLRGRPVTWGLVHGDFAPINLCDDGTCVTAFDVQGTPTLPLFRSLAHFLVFKDLRTGPSGPQLWGLDQTDLNVMVAALPGALRDDPAALRFFVGERWLRALYLDPGRIATLPHALPRIAAYLA